jgi:predicted RNase H-like nuclease (RuvC/YqgF family)
VSRAVKRANAGRQSTVTKLRAERKAHARTLDRAIAAEGSAFQWKEVAKAAQRERDAALSKVVEAEKQTIIVRAETATKWSEELQRVKAERDALADEAIKAAQEAREAEAEQAAVAQRVDDLVREAKASDRALVEAAQRIADLQRALDESRAAVTRLVTLHHNGDSVAVQSRAS